MLRNFYTLVLTLMLPLIFARLFWRSLRQDGYRHNIGERFGRYHQQALKDCIWIHAVSVGEIRAAEPLIRRLKTRYPTRPILLTCMTVTGRATAMELFGHTLTTVYLPYDFLAAHQRLLDHFKPSVLLIMETEIWPNLLYACAQNSVPALIVNARLSEKSFTGYARFSAVRSLVREALQSMRVIAAQSADDAGRFRALGALDIQKIAVTGNIKFDVESPLYLVESGTRWRVAQQARQILLCASTREGEEALLLAAYTQIFDADARRISLLVIVPRHPQRFDQVAAEIEKAGLSLARRSALTSDTAGQWMSEVLLGDSMGEMAAYFTLCDVAIIGGSFLPLGGQNLIEACALGKPVIMGPSTFNFAEAARLAEAAGAMQAVPDALEAMRSAYALLQDSARRKQMSNAGLKLVEANAGATEKTMALIAAALGAN